MEITKSRLDELIERKAKERVDEILKNLYRSFPMELDGNGNDGIEFNQKCGELAGINVAAYSDQLGLFNYDNGEKLLNEFTNWPELKKGLLDKYKADETDSILKQLNGINNFINAYSEL